MSLVFFTGRRRRKNTQLRHFKLSLFTMKACRQMIPLDNLQMPAPLRFGRTIQEATMEIKCMLQFFFDQPSSSRGISPGETCKKYYDRWTLVLFVSLGINSAPSVQDYNDFPTKGSHSITGELTPNIPPLRKELFYNDFSRETNG